MHMSVQLVLTAAALRLTRRRRHLPWSPRVHVRSLSTVYSGLELTCEPDIPLSLEIVEMLTSLASDQTNIHPPAHRRITAQVSKPEKPRTHTRAPESTREKGKVRAKTC